MKNTFGHSLQLTIFGESHGNAIGATLAGIAPGIKIDPDIIDQKLALRSAKGDLSTERQEKNQVEILSGVFAERTTGTPITLIIRNQDTRSKDYAKTAYVPRPGHADYAAFCKYHGFQDYRGGGHFSGRITAAVVAICTICEQALLAKNIIVTTHLKEVAGIEDRTFEQTIGVNNSPEFVKLAEELNAKEFAVIDEQQGAKMKQSILAAKNQQDSVGGILETAILGLEAGLGEPWFDSAESLLSHALFSIPAVKGVIFGDGLMMPKHRGSETNDSLFVPANKSNAEETLATKLKQISFASNHNGGINGGITNGMPILFSTIIKPTSSIAQKQKSVDLETLKNTTLEIEGRHDPAIIHRARQVVNSLTSFVICDLLSQRHGTDFLAQNDK